MADDDARSHQEQLDEATLTVAGNVAAEVAAQTVRPAVRRLRTRDLLIAGVCLVFVLMVIVFVVAYFDARAQVAQEQRDAIQAQVSQLESNQQQAAATIAVLRAELVRLGQNPDTVLKNAGVPTTPTKPGSSPSVAPRPSSTAPAAKPTPTPTKASARPTPIVSIPPVLPTAQAQPSPSPVISACVLIICVTG